MDYVTVFDASRKGLDWTAPLFGALFVVVGLRSLTARWSTPPYNRPFWRAFHVLFTLFGLGIATVIPVIQWTERRALVEALESGEANVAEGRVRDFVPMPWAGHAMECFTVDTTRFCYSDFILTPGFNNARSHGGPVHEGLNVRIHHVASRIARLEVAKDAGR